MKKNSNPYKLKKKEVITSEYINRDEFVNFLNKNKIIIKRIDNLPRFAKNNNILMLKGKREGKAGSAPTFYRPPKKEKINKIIKKMNNNNNSLLGRKLLKKKKEKILEIFDKAEKNKESRTSIAIKVSENLQINCNRKLVGDLLNQKRADKLEKLKKTS